jgi:hypothetical protein
MAKNIVYKNKQDKVRVRDKKVGNKTTSYITHGEKAGPKGFRRKAKVVDKKLPTGRRSTALYGSKKLLQEAGPMATGKPLRRELKDIKQSAKSVTINGRKYDTTKNKTANPNLRKKFSPGGTRGGPGASRKRVDRLKRGGSVKKKMKRGGRAK